MTTTVEPAQRKPNLKTKQDTAQRFAQLLHERNELVDENQKLRSENEDLRAANTVMKEQLETRFARRAELLRGVFPDFEQVLIASMVPEFIAAELVHLDNGPDVAYALGKNPRLCQELRDLRPDVALKKLREVAAFIEKKALIAQIGRAS